MMQATGPTTAIMHFDTERVSKLRPEQVNHIAYHIARLLAGERTSEREWLDAGIMVEIERDTDQGNEPTEWP
jgi:hypothetical protein